MLWLFHMWLVWLLQATGSQIGMVIDSLTNIGASVIIAFYVSWKLTLVILCFLPLVGLSGASQAKLLTGFANEDDEAMEEVGQVGSYGHLPFRPIGIYWFLCKNQSWYKICTLSLRYPVKLFPTSGPLQAWPKRAHLLNHMSRNLSFPLNLPKKKPTSMAYVLALLSVSSSWHMLLHLDMEAIWLPLRVYSSIWFSG